jgi:uncharacterized damage-inducible protein DinB
MAESYQEVAKRTRPALQAGEREMLAGWLDHHRAILRWKSEGLGDEQLRQRAVPPSTLSLLGLIRHMTLVEQGWFRQTFAGDDAPDVYDLSADPDADFNDVDSADPAEAFSVFERECAAAREIFAAASLDDLSKQASKRTGELISMRWIVTHMIEEYARHNGHADLLRERIDGATGYF